MQENQLQITSVHEAGHAVCGQSLGYVIARVSIEPTIERIGFCGADPHLSDLAASIWYMAGPYSEAKFRQSIGVEVCWQGSESDFDNVHLALSRLVPIPRATLFDAPLFKTAWADCEKLVDGLWPEIERFSAVLLERKTLVGTDLEFALAGRPILSIDDRREELDRIAAGMKRRRPESPKQDSTASAMFGKMIGHCFKDDVLARHGIGGI